MPHYEQGRLISVSDEEVKKLAEEVQESAKWGYGIEHTVQRYWQHCLPIYIGPFVRWPLVKRLHTGGECSFFVVRLGGRDLFCHPNDYYDAIGAISIAAGVLCGEREGENNSQEFLKEWSRWLRTHHGMLGDSVNIPAKLHPPQIPKKWEPPVGGYGVLRGFLHRFTLSAELARRERLIQDQGTMHLSSGINTHSPSWNPFNEAFRPDCFNCEHTENGDAVFCPFPESPWWKQKVARRWSCEFWEEKGGQA